MNGEHLKREDALLKKGRDSSPPVVDTLIFFLKSFRTSISKRQRMPDLPRFKEKCDYDLSESLLLKRFVLVNLCEEFWQLSFLSHPPLFSPSTPSEYTSFCRPAAYPGLQTKAQVALH